MRDRREWAGVLHPGPWVGPRAVGWGVLLVVLVGGSATLVSFLLVHQLGMPKDGPWSAVVLGLMLFAALALYACAVRFGERRQVSELALPYLGQELGAGLVGGVVVFSLVIGVMLVSGAYSIAGPAFGPPWRGFQVGFGPGFFEELVFRGVLMRLLWEAFGARAALAVSATLFGLAHILNPGHDVVGPVSIIFEAGLPLGALYLLTNRLWASIGAHAGWNFAQGYIFGAKVSGTHEGAHFFLVVPRAGVPVLLTGGAFGPEASVVAVAAGTVVGILLLLWARRLHADDVWAVS